VKVARVTDLSSAIVSACACRRRSYNREVSGRALRCPRAIRLVARYDMQAINPAVIVEIIGVTA